MKFHTFLELTLDYPSEKLENVAAGSEEKVKTNALYLKQMQNREGAERIDLH